MMNEKEFDCIEEKQNAQRLIYEEIKDMSHEQEIAYFRKTSSEGSLGEWWKKVKAKSVVPAEQE